MGRKRRDKNAADNPVESLEGKRIIGFGRGNGPLNDADMVAVHEAALALLANTGLGEASPIVVDLVVAAGGGLDSRGRLLFSPDLVTAALAGLRRDITLYGRAGDNDMTLSSGVVHVGTGGASPLIFDAGLANIANPILWIFMMQRGLLTGLTMFISSAGRLLLATCRMRVILM